jgi:redox-sensing transcriptional repressor
MTVHRDVHPDLGRGDAANADTLVTTGPGVAPDAVLAPVAQAFPSPTINELAASGELGSGPLGADSAGVRVIPEATVARLATYLRVLAAMDDVGVETVSSEELAEAAGVNSAKLRKDLSYVGSYGVRGVGYAVSTLVEQLISTLGLEERRAVALIGVGNLGQALAGYGGFMSRGFRIAALLDVDPRRVGTSIRGLSVRHLDDLAEVVESEAISIAVIAVPAGAAQDVCDRLAAAGVTAILNFAPTVVSVPDHVDVRKVDLAAELQILSFHEQRKARSGRPAVLASEAAR